MINGTTVKERIRQFDLAHGDDPVIISGWVLFADGAQREVSCYGMQIDPPTNLAERHKLIVHYWETKVKFAEEDFRETEGQALAAGKEGLKRNWGIDGQPHIEKLKKCRAVVLERRKKLEEAKEQMNKVAPEVTAREAANARSREQAQAFLEEVKSIRI